MNNQLSLTDIDFIIVWLTAQSVSYKHNYIFLCRADNIKIMPKFARQK